MVQLALTGIRYKVVEGPNQQPIVVVRDQRTPRAIVGRRRS